MTKKIIIISGATATGKSSLAIELAQKFGGEIINFDSLLFYQELNIGVAKPSTQELSLAPHHLVGTQSIALPLNAHQFVLKAIPIIDELHQKNKPVYLVGGSGFYLQALIKGMYDSPSTPKEVIERSNNLYQKEGVNAFIDLLKIHDPKALDLFHANDHYRIRRAVEHFWNLGTQYSAQKELHKTRQTLAEEKQWQILHNYLSVPKEEHEPIIRARTQLMFDLGLEAEVKNLLQSFSGEEKPLKSIGYLEMIAFLRGEITSRADCQERINLSTRQLAKAQRTWFNRIDDKLTFHPKKDHHKVFEATGHFLGK